jgi:HD-like signal output (HDOD) protein
VKPAAADLELLRGVCRRGIPPLPSQAFRLALELAGDEGSNNDLLVEQLEGDPRLEFGMLAGANLAMFGGGRPVKTIRQAVAQLGRRKCLSLLWLVALSDFLRAWPDLNETARLKLWRHSLLTGVLAHQLLHAAGLVALGDALAAGMAHDVGHLLLVSPGARLGVVWHEEHDQLVEGSVSPAPERDHCRLGASLLALWEAPSGLVASALHHHDPSAADAAHRPLVVGVRLADLLAEHINLDRPARPLRLEVEPAWQQLAAFEPWNQVTDLQHLAIERLIDSLLIAEHLANLLGG